MKFVEHTQNTIQLELTIKERNRKEKKNNMQRVISMQLTMHCAVTFTSAKLLLHMKQNDLIK